MSHRIAIVQSNYVPWKGYFDLIRSVDEFVLLDEVQYTRRDWRNRNRVRTVQATAWLTIPVEVKGRYDQSISETNIADPTWADRHLRTLEQAYATAPHMPDMRKQLQHVYARAGEMRRLSDVNRCFLDFACELLGIDTPITWSSDYASHGAKTERLVSLCQAAGATEYISGPAAREYLDETMFNDVGIDVSWARYAQYPEYEQLHDRPFEHAVSILDLLLNTGTDAHSYLGGVKLEGSHVSG